MEKEKGAGGMHSFRVEGQQPYVVGEIERIRTPRLLVFRDRVERNLERMKRILEEAAPGSGYGHLCAHVKTHKSSMILQRMIEAGILSHKTTVNEAELAARSGAEEVFVAYPLLDHDAERLSEAVVQFPETRFFVQIGSMEHAHILRRVCEAKGIVWRYYIDLDVGMHRTGAAPEEAYRLYAGMLEWDGFEFVGLHGYDGHNHHREEAERRKEAERSMGVLLNAVRTFQRKGVAVERVMAAGSVSFLEDLRLLHGRLGNNTRLYVSPGNWVYWDSEYDRLLPGAFEIAAVVLAQVIESGRGRITLNCGHKRWGADRGPVDQFSHPALRVVSFSEEHTVLAHPPEVDFHIGDYVLIVPRHACSTVNLYEHFAMIGEEGRMETMDAAVDGRNR